MIQFALVAAQPIQMTRVLGILRSRGALELPHPLKGAIDMPVLSIQGVRYFHKKQAGDNLLVDIKRVRGGLKEMQASVFPGEIGMLHAKLSCGDKEVQAKVFPSGKVMVTAGYPSGHALDRTHVTVFLDALQEALSYALGSETSRKLNLFRVDLLGQTGGSYDREELRRYLRDHFQGVRNSDTDAERVQAFSKSHPGFSLLVQRRGKVQLIMSGKERGFTVKDVFDFVAYAERMHEGLAGRNNVYSRNVVDLSECSGNPVASPREVTGDCPEGMFVFPSKKGVPCCKAVPKYHKSKAFRESVTRRYGVVKRDLPPKVRALFGEPSRPLPKADANGPLTLQVSGRGSMKKRGAQDIYKGFYINGKECYRYSAKEIKDMGRSLGLDVSSLRKGANICKEIDVRSRARGFGVNRTNGYEEAVTPPRSDLNTLKSRFEAYRCSLGTKKRGFYSVQEVQGMAEMLGIRGYSRMKKADLCSLIKKRIASL